MEEEVAKPICSNWFHQRRKRVRTQHKLRLWWRTVSDRSRKCSSLIKNHPVNLVNLYIINISYLMFCGVVLLSIFTSCAVF